jgi:transcriptional regulator with XRE-family HTH domain
MAATPTPRANERLMVQLARCRARGMTAREVAAEAGLHYSVLSALAHGRRTMRPAVAARLSSASGRLTCSPAKAAIRLHEARKPPASAPRTIEHRHPQRIAAGGRQRAPPTRCARMLDGDAPAPLPDMSDTEKRAREASAAPHHRTPMSDSDAIRWLDLHALMAQEPPPVPWLVEPLLARGHLTMLAGAAGVGKSLLALGIAGAVAHGAPSIAGMPVVGGEVVLIDAENGERTLHERAHLVGLPPDRVRAGIAGTLNLRDAASAGELQRALASRPPVLLVLDSFASLAPGLRENDAHEVGPVLDRLRRLAQDTGAAVLLLHHTRKSGDSYRGGTGIPAAVDVAAVYVRPETSEHDRRVIDWSPQRGGKMRLGPEPDARHMRVEVVAGVLTVTATEPPVRRGPQHTASVRDDLQARIVAEVAARGPRPRADLFRAVGCDPKDRTGRRAVDAAIDAGQLVRTDDGTYTIAQGGTPATPATATAAATATCHPAPGCGWQAAPYKGAATCHPASPLDADDEAQAELDRIADKFPELIEEGP